MDTLVKNLEQNEMAPFLIGETNGEEKCEKKQDAPESAALGASSVACATSVSATEYSTNESTCQIAPTGEGEPEGNKKSARFVADVMEHSTQATTCQIEASGQTSDQGDATNKKAAFVAAHPDSQEYTIEAAACQIEPIPTLEEIEALLGDAAHQRIEAAYRELEETRARLTRERVAREKALAAMHGRLSEPQGKVVNLGGERTKMEERARAFLGGEALKEVLNRIHLAFNARQLELEADIQEGEAALAEAESEAQAVDLTDALELQLAEQELERLEGAAPEVAERVRLTLSAAGNLSSARQAIQEGMLQDAIVLLERAKQGGADAVEIAEAERELKEAQEKKHTRALIARITANPDQIGATRHIHKLMEEARKAGIAEQVTPFANKALDIAREAANARFLQARPIADHLAAEGYVPVVGDGRIEAWRQIRRNGNGNFWSLERILTLRSREGWTTETPRNTVTQKELPARVRHSRWYHPERANPTR